MTKTPEESQDPELDALIAEYMRAVDAGSPPDRTAFVAAHPEKADGLRSFFNDLTGIRKINGLARINSCHRAGELLLQRYRLDVLIGEGGFGEVWRGFDLTLKRPVAIKLPRVQLPEGAGADSFLAEARRVARLRHPGIVTVHDVGRSGSAYFIVSEFINGSHLGDYVRQHQSTVDEIGRLFVDVAVALAHAHSEGIVHRDLKPANLLVDRHDQVFLADFGIANAAEEAALGNSAGTPAYLAPEQWNNTRVLDWRRCDIYSLGVVLFELLAGQRPFAARTVDELRRRVLHDDPPRPSKFNPNVSKHWDDIVVRCLAKDPGMRYASVDQLIAACHKPQPTVREAVDRFQHGITLLVLLPLVFCSAVSVRFISSNSISGEQAGILAGIAASSLVVGAGLLIRRNNLKDVVNLGGLPTPASLRKGEWPERYHRFRTLRETGKFSSLYYGAVIDLLEIPSPECRREILEWLIKAGPEVIPSLIVALRESASSSHDHCRALVIAITCFGSTAEAAIPVLKSMRRDSTLIQFIDQALIAIEGPIILRDKIKRIVLAATICCITMVVLNSATVYVTCLGIFMGWLAFWIIGPFNLLDEIGDLALGLAGPIIVGVIIWIAVHGR